VPRQVRAAIPLALACAVFGACDGNSDQVQVEATVRDFAVAYLEGEGETVCALMTASAGEQAATDMKRTFRELTGERKPFSCPDAVALTSAFIRGAGPDDQGVAQDKEAAAEAALATLRAGEGAGSIAVDGSTAKASGVAGLDGAELTLTMVGDEWRISDVR
jgi:hypothetical protein